MFKFKSKSQGRDPVFVVMFLVVVAVTASITLQCTVSKARGNDVAAFEQQMKTSGTTSQKF